MHVFNHFHNSGIGDQTSNRLRNSVHFHVIISSKSLFMQLVIGKKSKLFTGSNTFETAGWGNKQHSPCTNTQGTIQKNTQIKSCQRSGEKKLSASEESLSQDHSWTRPSANKTSSRRQVYLNHTESEIQYVNIILIITMAFPS